MILVCFGRVVIFWMILEGFASSIVIAPGGLQSALSATPSNTTFTNRNGCVAASHKNVS